MAELRHVWLCFLLAMPDVYLIIWPIYWLTSKISWWVNLLQYSLQLQIISTKCCFGLKKSTCFTFAATDWMLGNNHLPKWLEPKTSWNPPSLKAPEAAPRCRKKWGNSKMGCRTSDDFWENTTSVEDRLIFDDLGVVQRGVLCLPFCLKIRPFFLRGWALAVFFLGKRRIYFFVVCVIFGWENIFNCLFKTRPEDSIFSSD